MKAPKEIVECVKKYEKLNAEVQRKREEFDAELKRIEKEMDKCRGTFREWTGELGVHLGDLYIADKPEGDKQRADGEYSNQVCRGEDWYTGTYYHQIEDSDKYVAYDYEIW